MFSYIFIEVTFNYKCSNYFAILLVSRNIWTLLSKYLGDKSGTLMSKTVKNDSENNFNNNKYVSIRNVPWAV